MLSLGQDLLTAVAAWWEQVSPRSAEEKDSGDAKKFRAWLQDGVSQVIRLFEDSARELHRRKRDGGPPAPQAGALMDLVRMLPEEERRLLAWWILNGMPRCG
jgi:hypothetical protein